MLAHRRAGQRDDCHRKAHDVASFMTWRIPWLLPLAGSFCLTARQIPSPYFRRVAENYSTVLAVSGPKFMKFCGDVGDPS